MNIPLLRQIQAQIVQHPESFNMNRWGYDCGTAACVAGWACRIERAELDGFSGIRRKAAVLLGLSRAQAERLFYEEDWPNEFIIEGGKVGCKTLAKAVVARIDHFIATGGAE